MELPKDIIGCLEKYLKSKRFSMIDKFCRDAYFRKNMVRINHIPCLVDTSILKKYKIRILGEVDFAKIDRTVDLGVSDNIVKIGDFTSVINTEKYIRIRKSLPNLEKMICRVYIHDENIMEALNYKPIKGISFMFCVETSPQILEKIVRLGHEITLGNNPPTTMLSHLGSNLSSITRLSRIDESTLKLGVLPEVKYIECSKQSVLPLIKTNISNYPKLKKIIYYASTIPERIIRSDGFIVSIYVLGDEFHIPSIQNLEAYCKMREYYDVLSLADTEIGEIIDYEKVLNTEKRATLRIWSGHDIGKIEEVIEIFDIEMIIDPEEIRGYIIKFGKYKTKINKDNQIVFVFKIGSGKLSLIYVG